MNSLDDLSVQNYIFIKHLVLNAVEHLLCTRSRGAGRCNSVELLSNPRVLRYSRMSDELSLVLEMFDFDRDLCHSRESLYDETRLLEGLPRVSTTK
jgi:hypothetical protein